MIKSESFGIITVKKTISRWPDKFRDTFPENIETARDLYVMIRFIPFDNSRWEERVFLKSMSCLRKVILYIFLVT